MPPSREETFAAALGAAVFFNRRARGWSQEGLAHRARSHGLRWSRSTVAAVENGTKTLDVTELILLAGTLSLGVLQLLDSDGEVWLSPDAYCSMKVIRNILTTEEYLDMTRSEIEVEVGAPGGGRPITPAELVGRGEAEQKAARRLGWTPSEVAQVALVLWGQSLSDERDDRVVDNWLDGDETELFYGEDDRSNRTLQAIRGHVTRELLKELASHGKEGSP